ncbi:hypothetical protein [Nocardia neocaledoniensis]|uniref:hypothetical protein n=1 Tax=Nocardia neocaledoniensis TaxID=236511 RepID=UPI00245574BF|nr:hypothetical protein [Nocardia neocaledoniensis]
MSDERSIDDAVSTPNTEITALAQQVATARGKLPLQHDTALYDALSDSEIRAERELAEWIRAQRRKQRRRAVADELAAEKRDRRTGALIRRTDEADARWHRKALAARRRVSSADARLAQLYRRAEWSSRALIGVVVLGMVWAGVNVQHNLVPSGDMSDPLYWLSFGIEAMISIPIITIMVAATTAARWGRELERGKVLVFELALLGTTVALNAGPHLAAGAWGRAAEYSIAPVMVGVVIWLHAWVSARYALLIESASVELPGEVGTSFAPSERVSEVRAVRETGSVLDQALSAVTAPSSDRSYAPTAQAAAEPAQADTAVPDSAADQSPTDPADVATGSAPDVIGGAAPIMADTTSARQAVSAAAGITSHTDGTGPDHAVTTNASGVATSATSGSTDAVVPSDTSGVAASAASGSTDAVDISTASRSAAADDMATPADVDGVASGSEVLGTDSTSASPRTGAVADSSFDGAARAVAEADLDSVAAEDVSERPASADQPAGEVVAPARIERKLPAGRHPSVDKATAPGTLELIHKAAVDHRRTADYARTSGATPTVRRIPATAAAQATAGAATGTDPVPEATAHAGSVARDRNGDTAAPEPVHIDPQPTADEPEQLTLTTELDAVPTRTEPAPDRQLVTPVPKKPATEVAAADAKDLPRDDDAAAPTEPRLDSDDLTPDYDFDDDNEVRALARQIAHRSPLRLTLDQIEEILELTDQSWSARSIGAEVGVSGTTVTNIVEFARKIRQPYAFTG